MKDKMETTVVESPARLLGLNEIERGAGAVNICGAVRAQLSEYLDAELDSTMCRALEQHLRACSECRVFVDTFQKTILLYRELQPARRSSHAQARLIEVLHLDTAKTRRG